MFKGRDILIVTQHKKERVIAPLLEKSFGVNCIVADKFDTDKLGSFTGEIERLDDPFSAARKKCIYGLQSYDCDLAIASEGSFGAHPEAFFLPMDEEILIFVDLKNSLEVIAVERSIDTNFNASIIYNEKQLIDFAQKTKFPSHLLILKDSKDNFIDIQKGMKDWLSLKIAFRHFLNNYGQVYVETDMRAMNNPTRMRVIEKAAVKLINKINSTCPICETPGFGIVEMKRGLPCSVCKNGTQSILSLLYKCNKCCYTKEDSYPNQKHFEDPMYCDRCNP